MEEFDATQHLEGSEGEPSWSLQYTNSDYEKLILQHSEAEYVRFQPKDLHGFDIFRGPNIEKSRGHLASTTQGVICHSNWNAVVVWIPTIQRCVALQSPVLYPFEGDEDMTYTGLGFDTSTETLKVVKFCVLDFEHAAVLSFNTQQWKEGDRLSNDIDLMLFPDVAQLLVRQVAYWLAYAEEGKSAPKAKEEKAQGNGPQMTIIGFDFETESFKAIDFPLKTEPYNLQISQWQCFLAVLNYKETENGRVWDIWVMDGDAWAKLFFFTFAEGLRRSAFLVMNEGDRVLATTPFGTLDPLLTKFNTHQPLALDPSHYNYVFADYCDGVDAHHFAHHFMESLPLIDEGMPLPK